MHQSPENLSRIVDGFAQKIHFSLYLIHVLKIKSAFFLLGSHEDSHGHCYNNVKRSDKEIDENYRDNYLDNKELFLISDDTKMKGKMNVAILESFVNFYKNHS